MDPTEVAQFLSSLSPEEQAQIRPVLERDLEFQRREKQRLRLLKTSVDLSKSEMLQKKSSICSMKDSLSNESMHSALSANSTSPCPSSTASAATSPGIRACTQCGHKLGFLFNAGTKCKKCAQLICDNCRVYTTKEKKYWTCPVCFKEREFLAASGEWMCESLSPPAPVSQLLLSQMSRIAMDKRNERRTSEAGNINQRSRAPMMRSRNLTLPSIHHDNLLFVPQDDQIVITHQRPRSPSPVVGHRAVQNTHNLMPGISPREIIGSPAPRAAPVFPSSPVGGPGPPESIPEDAVASCDTDSPILPLSVTSRGRRQSWHTANSRIRRVPTLIDEESEGSSGELREEDEDERCMEDRRRRLSDENKVKSSSRYSSFSRTPSPQYLSPNHAWNIIDRRAQSDGQHSDTESVTPTRSRVARSNSSDVTRESDRDSAAYLRRRTPTEESTDMTGTAVFKRQPAMRMSRKARRMNNSVSHPNISTDTIGESKLQLDKTTNSRREDQTANYEQKESGQKSTEYKDVASPRRRVSLQKVGRSDAVCGQSSESSDPSDSLTSRSRSARNSVDRVIERHRANSQTIPPRQVLLTPEPRRPASAVERVHVQQPLRSPTHSITDNLYVAKSQDELSVESEYSTCSLEQLGSSFSNHSIFTPSHNNGLFLGEIQLNLHYDVGKAVLIVYVKQCRSLPHFGVHRPSPYVKLTLVPRHSCSATNLFTIKRKTSFKRSSVDPVYEEHIRDLPPPDPAPPPKYSVKLSFVFKIEDRERKIGTLELLFDSITFHGSVPVQGKEQLAIIGKLYFNEKRIAKARTGTVTRTGEERANFFGKSLTFKQINLNDLHVRSLKLQLLQTIGLANRSIIGQVSINDYAHRRGRSIVCPCGCEFCAPWHQMINNSTHISSCEITFASRLH